MFHWSAAYWYRTSFGGIEYLIPADVLCLTHKFLSILLVNAAYPLLRCPYREVCSHAFRGCSNVEVCSHTFSLLATFSIEMSGRVYNSSIGLQAIMKGPIWMYYSPTSSTTVNWIPLLFLDCSSCSVFKDWKCCEYCRSSVRGVQTIMLQHRRAESAIATFLLQLMR